MTGDADRVGSKSLGLRPRIETGVDAEPASAADSEADEEIHAGSESGSRRDAGPIVRGVGSLPGVVLVIVAAIALLAVAEWSFPWGVDYAGAAIGLALMVVGYRSIRGSGDV